MANENKGNVFAIAIMFMLFFMIAFVTNFAGSMGIIVKNQFGASNTASQFGSAANFFAYLFMGIPGGLILKRKGYKFTALLAVGVGIAGLAVQLTSGFVSSFAVYVTGAFIAGFSMCLLNLVVNPLLNTLGGGGNKGNQLVQFGCSLNSIGATLAPILLGYLIGGEVAKAKVMDAAPAMYIAIGIFVLAFLVLAFSAIPEPGIFMYITVETGIPNQANLYMSAEKLGDAANPAFVGAAVAGAVVGVYWFCMMIGRLIGGAIGGKVSSRTQIAFCSLVGILLMLATIYTPVKMVTVFGKTFPLSMCFMALCGLVTSVMWGGIFNMAAEGLGKYVPMGSGIFMAMVVGGLMLPVQGLVADKVGYLNSYWFTIALLAYILFYALVGSRVTKRAE